MAKQKEKSREGDKDLSATKRKKKMKEKVKISIENLKLELENEKLVKRMEDMSKKIQEQEEAIMMEKKEKENDIEERKKENKRLEERNQELRQLHDQEIEELTCVICAQLMLYPMVVNCGHMFCSMCIATWSKSNSRCPTCRTIINNLTKSCQINILVDKKARLMSVKDQEERKERQSEHETTITSLKSENLYRLNELMKWNSVSRTQSVEIVEIDDSDVSFSESDSDDSSFIMSD